MTEQEKRYVAEKMLGWKVVSDRADLCGDHYIMGDEVQIACDAVDFTSEEWLGPLWKALVEKHSRGETRGPLSLIPRGVIVTPYGKRLTKMFPNQNPNLAVIVAHKALEGVKA